MQQDIFANVRNALLNARSIDEEVAAAKQLQGLLLALLERFELTACCYDARRTELAGGVALAPKHALDCLDDPLRTRRFIYGVYLALTELEQRFAGQPLEVLYAGCGPVAPLVLPLLGAFSSLSLRWTLVDVNAASIETVSALIEHLGLVDLNITCKQADAIRYCHSHPLHLAVTETMDKGLTKEPQIRVMQNLSAQLVEGGILLPERIALFIEQVPFEQLPFFTPGDSITPFVAERSNETLLFELTKTLPQSPAFVYCSDWLINQYSGDVVLTAQLTVLGEIALTQGQSQISNPYLLCHRDKLIAERYQVSLNTEHMPTWQLLAASDLKA